MSTSYESAPRAPRAIGQVALLALAVIALPLVTGNEFYLDIAVNIAALAAAGMAWNLLGGYTGQLSLGHAMFFGVGAYSSVQLAALYDISPWIGAVIGGLVAATFGALIAAVTLRLRGPFFTLATIAAGQILYILAIELEAVTGGSGGLSVPFEPGWQNMFFTDRGDYLWLLGGLLVVVYAFTKWIERRRLGYQAVAVRENVDAAEALGIDTVAVKLKMTALSAFFTALAGAGLAQYLGFIDPESGFGLNESIEIVLVAIIGGMGLAAGPLIGAVLIVLLETILRNYLGTAGSGGLYLVIYGGLLILVVLLVPKGLLGSITDRARKAPTSPTRSATTGQEAAHHA